MMAFCLLVYRVNEEIEMDDVIDLHEDLVEALAMLYLDEENKSTERLVGNSDDDEPGADEIDQVEKK